MKTLRTLLAAGAVLAALTASSHTFDTETLTYRVMYKWGLVNKQAGRATLSIRPDGDNYAMLLTARSEPWADRLYKVRDTLQGSMERDTMRPLFYRKKAHEGSDHKNDVVRYSYEGNRVIGDALRQKRDDNGRLKVNEQRRLTATGTTVDILSAFYYMRTLPYPNWQPGHTLRLNIYSGKQQETLTIKYVGREDLTIGNTTHSCYHIRFVFTSDGGKKSSDDMDAWIETSKDRVPVKLEGKVAVGKVQCLLIP